MRKFLVMSLALAFLLSISVVTLVSAEPAKAGAKAAPAKKAEAKPAATAKKAEKKEKKASKVKVITTGAVNINEAADTVLEKVPGIGKKAAQDIIKARPYTSIEELLAKKILTQKKFDAAKACLKTSGASDLKVDRVPAQPVNINTASAKDMELIPGVGPKTAKAIVDARKATPFKAIEDIKNVEGVGDGKFEEMKAYITVK